ncbi:hypothetical protein AQS70_22955 [Pseudomonas endophytica]|uniref:Uncharacterized protein n=1 Tax=Pseudomonas endophytica TaxID=1563157 RepID=A0A0Q0T213_9PSED|nr:hypothetical protein [Pseudomonas endophytica]KQB53853.1 hypothetical protein AQS70_22955 [Pseudomonas endophytica]
MGIGNCCSAAMAEVEDTGSSDKFLNYGTDEKGCSLVTGYECKECGDKWSLEVQTQAPDRKKWFPIDQSRFN